MLWLKHCSLSSCPVLTPAGAGLKTTDLSGTFSDDKKDQDSKREVVDIATADVPNKAAKKLPPARKRAYSEAEVKALIRSQESQDSETSSQLEARVKDMYRILPETESQDYLGQIEHVPKQPKRKKIEYAKSNKSRSLNPTTNSAARDSTTDKGFISNGIAKQFDQEMRDANGYKGNSEPVHVAARRPMRPNTQEEHWNLDIPGDCKHCMQNESQCSCNLALNNRE